MQHAHVTATSNILVDGVLARPERYNLDFQPAEVRLGGPGAPNDRLLDFVHLQYGVLADLDLELCRREQQGRSSKLELTLAYETCQTVYTP